MAIKGGFAPIEALMHDHENPAYDSGEDGILPECRSCSFHRPYAVSQTCVYRYCPYAVDEVSTLRKTPMKLAYVNPNPQRKVD